MKYLSPLKRRDSFVLKMKISEVSATRMRFEYYIFKLTNKELALEGTSVVVWLDENLRPTRIPTEAKLKLKSYLDNGSVEESIHVAESSPI
ncbi:acyl-acyl carrier protein thioesterase TE3, chloroplastic-like isoform X2 [Nymphaea colorata]|uniref:acyl-acyl carrier protein thioesterase TE3, chloroplastic-like isoform X1 n=1 Tax=Nymphaea colorata TaxID=210225 RepID=UPI00214F2118|nr:acyl-acyl carrier protein thioesterase TE3, chloroplastic-like isoform X1 [Nymphaea colorata]XP_049936306.1 acyl-acyl carrier protein thioesterase TE3, chloroplastic-like isoform X2 [Nymphaea colorata]